MTSGSPDVPGAGPPCRLVLLVGFMASGKSSVGARLASRLGWEFFDADAEVEARTASSVEALFHERGEPAFRRIEDRVMAELLSGTRRVVASGGGWPAAGPGRLDRLPADVLSVWLRVPAALAVERAGLDGPRRPLLAGDDPEGRARELLESRRPAYARARLHLEAWDLSPDALAAAVVEHLERVGGVPT